MLDTTELSRLWQSDPRNQCRYPNLTLTPIGVVLGAGTLVIKAVSEHGETGLDITGNEAEILALLSATYGEAISPQVMPHFHGASRWLKKGDKATACIALAHAGLPDLPRRSEEGLRASERLFKAGMLVATQGVTPSQLMVGLGLLPPGVSAATWRKMAKGYNPDEARDERGRWTDGGGGRIQVADNRPLFTISDASPQKQWKQAWVGQPNEAMRVFLADKEDPHGKYASSYGYEGHNDETGALGRYQFLESTLVGLGVQSKDGSWNTDFARKYNIKTDDDFLNNEGAQEEAMTLYMNDLDRQIDNLYNKYKDKEFVDVKGDRITITRAGLVAALHRSGIRDVRDYFDAYGAGNTQGKPLDKYDKRVETRLREAQHIPYTRAN